jgi:hypothetical protein
MNAQPENNIKNNDNVWENIKIEEDKAEGGQIISYIKKGRGYSRTKATTWGRALRTCIR